jgi:hypothetical protein
MQNRITKFIAVLLTVTLLLQFSAPVLAQSAQADEVMRETTVDPAHNPVESEKKSPEIVGEMTEQREENAKHFRMSDGSFMVAQYGYPIHFQDQDGAWQDIDNTMEEVDKNQSDDEKEYKNKKAKEKYRLANKAKEGKTVTIDADGHTISWGLVQTAKSKLELQSPTDAQSLTGNDRFLSLPNLSQVAWYRDVYDAVDLQYILSPTGVKENIVLKDKRAANSFDVEYRINDLHAVQINTHTIELLDAQEKRCIPFMHRSWKTLLKRSARHSHFRSSSRKIKS